MTNDREKLIAASKNFARRKAKEIRKQFGSNKKKLSKVLYDKLSIKYGFEESVNSGNFGPFPHEVKTQAICFIYATYQYLLAEALGLKPHMYWGYGLKYYRKKVDTCGYDHAFIDVDVGTKQRVLIDIHMGIYGHVTYSDNLFTVKDNYVTKYCKCQYKYLQKQNLDEIIAALMYLRTPQGSIGVLKQGQKINQNCMCCFNPESRVLEIHYIVTTPISPNSVFIQKHLFNNGYCDNSKMEFYMFSHYGGWMQYNRQLHLCTIEIEIVNKIFKVVGYIAKNTRKTKSREIVDYLIKCGNNESGIPIKHRQQFNKVFLVLQNILKAELDKATKSAVLLQKSLALKALYLQKRKSDDYLFTQKERDQYLEKTVETYAYEYLHYIKILRQELLKSIKAKRHTTTNSCAKRDAIHKVQNLEQEICQLKKFKYYNSRWYNEVNDILCFQRQLKPSELDHVDKIYIFRAYSEVMLHQIVLAYQYSHNQKHLAKLSKKIKAYQLLKEE